MRPLLAALLFSSVAAFAGPIGVDGMLGPEWAGIAHVSVAFSAAAPAGNFGSPTALSNTVAYDIYARGDANYLYGLFVAQPAEGDNWSAGALDFVNLYIDTNPFVVSGSDVGFEVLNDRAFRPGYAGYSGPLSSQGFTFAVAPGNATTGTGIEFAMPWAYFLNDPQGVGFPVLSDGGYVRFNLSQSFGYSVAGGAADYGTSRLGLVQYESDPAPTPEPGTWGLLSGGPIAGLAMWCKRISK